MSTVERTRNRIRRQLELAGVGIHQTAGAIHLTRGQRHVIVVDLRYVDSSDLRALGALPPMSPGRWRVADDGAFGT